MARPSREERVATGLLREAGHEYDVRPPRKDAMAYAVPVGLRPEPREHREDPGLAEVDDLSILRSGAVLTFQRRGESDEQHAARHRARYREWRGIPKARPSVSPLSP